MYPPSKKVEKKRNKLVWHWLKMEWEWGDRNMNVYGNENYSLISTSLVEFLRLSLTH